MKAKIDRKQIRLALLAIGACFACLCFCCKADPEAGPEADRAETIAFIIGFVTLALVAGIGYLLDKAGKLPNEPEMK